MKLGPLLLLFMCSVQPVTCAYQARGQNFFHFDRHYHDKFKGFVDSVKDSTKQRTRRAVNRQINRFHETKFDPDYDPTDICEPWNSGMQTSDLKWAEPADRLTRLISKDNGYNMFMPPGQHKGETTNVSVALYIESMSSVKAQTMDFEVDCYLAMGWYDRRLSHNCTHPILITHKFISDEIWNPDLYYVNAKYAYLQEVTTPNFMMFVYPDGLVFKSMRTVVTLSCMVDLQFFPMDKQSCPLTIQSYAYIENLLSLSWHEDTPYYPIASNEGLKLNDMEITNITFDNYISALDVWHFVSQALIFLVLLEYSFVSYFMTRGSQHCRHRLASDARNLKQSISVQSHSGLNEDLRVKLMQNNNFEHPSKDGKRGSCFGLTRLKRTNSNMDRQTGTPAKRFSVATGVENCVAHAAMLCRLASMQQQSRRLMKELDHQRRSVFEIEHDTAELIATHCNVSMESVTDRRRPCSECQFENEEVAKSIDAYSRIVFPSVFSAFTFVYWCYYGYYTRAFS